MPPRWSLPFRFQDQHFVSTSYLSHAYYMPFPPHPPRLDHSNNIRVYNCEPYWAIFSGLLLLLTYDQRITKKPNYLFKTGAHISAAAFSFLGATHNSYSAWKKMHNRRRIRYPVFQLYNARYDNEGRMQCKVSVQPEIPLKMMSSHLLYIHKHWQKKLQWHSLQ